MLCCVAKQPRSSHYMFIHFFAQHFFSSKNFKHVLNVNVNEKKKIVFNKWDSLVRYSDLYTKKEKEIAMAFSSSYNYKSIHDVTTQYLFSLAIQK